MMHAARRLQANGSPLANDSGLTKAANGAQETAYGYKWERDDVIENLPGEVWKRVPENVLPGKYSASTMGRIQNKHGKLMMGCMSNGYIIVGEMNVRVNRIVAFTFCENDDPDTKIEVKHLNNNKTDNRASNLMWDLSLIHISEPTRPY